MSAAIADEAWVTLATNDSYAMGCLVLAHSLRRVATNRKVHCMVTAEVSQGVREQLNTVFDAVTQVNPLDSGDTANLALIGRPDLGCTFTKLHCWRLTQYRRAVFMDADTLVLRNADNIFTDWQPFAAAPDIGWPDMFNSGVFLYEPSDAEYARLVNFAVEHGSFDGGDQGLLNDFFSDWSSMDGHHRLPFTFNMSAGAVYTYKAAYKRYGPEIRIVHFLGTNKPWQAAASSDSMDQSPKHSHLTYWWHIYCNDVAPVIPQKLPSPTTTATTGSKSELAPITGPLPASVVRFDPTVVEHRHFAQVKDDKRPQARLLRPRSAAEMCSAPLVTPRSGRRRRSLSLERESGDPNSFPPVGARHSLSSESPANGFPPRESPSNVSPSDESPSNESPSNEPCSPTDDITVISPTDFESLPYPRHTVDVRPVPMAPKVRVFRIQLAPLRQEKPVPSAVKYGFESSSIATDRLTCSVIFPCSENLWSPSVRCEAPVQMNAVYDILAPVLA